MKYLSLFLIPLSLLSWDHLNVKRNVNTEFETGVCKINGSDNNATLYCINGDMYYLRKATYKRMFDYKKYRCTCFPGNEQYIVRQDLNITE